MIKKEYLEYDILNDSEYKKASFQEKHLKMIRYRLMKGREYYNSLNHKKLSRKDTIKKMNENGIEISEQTFDSLFDPKSSRSRIDISAVVYMCQLLDLSISQVLAFPEETLLDDFNISQILMNVEKPQQNNQKESQTIFNKFKNYFDVLDDPNYNGTFYIYFLRYSGTDDSFYQEYPDTLCKTEDLMEGTLTFDIQKNSGSIAKLEYIQQFSMFDNTIESKKKCATCTPLLSTVNNNVHLRFVDNDGRVYQIVFDRQEFFSGKCYFRIAGMFIESSDHGHFPIFQKVLLLREKIHPKYYNYIKGCLNLNHNTLIISNNTLSNLAKDDPEIQRFIECYQDELKPYEKPLLVFDEDIILSNNSKMSKADRKKVLLKLRHQTFSQNQVYIGNDKYAYRIFKEIQQASNENISAVATQKELLTSKEEINKKVYDLDCKTKKIQELIEQLQCECKNISM